MKGGQESGCVGGRGQGRVGMVQGMGTGAQNNCGWAVGVRLTMDVCRHTLN